MGMGITTVMGKYYNREDYIKLRSVAKFKLQVGDRIIEVQTGNDGFDSYKWNWNTVPNDYGSKILEVNYNVEKKSYPAVRIHGSGKKWIQLHRNWVVAKTKGEDEARKKQLYEKDFQKQRVLRCIEEVDDYIKNRKNLAERTLSQIPIGKRFTFLGGLTDRQKRIFELMYEDFTTQKDSE